MVIRRLESNKLRPPIIFGWLVEKNNSGELLNVIRLIEKIGLSFVALALNSGNYESKSVTESKKYVIDPGFHPLGESDLALTYDYWSQRIVAYISQDDLSVIKTEIEWASYVGARAIIIDMCYIWLGEGNEQSSYDKIANLSQMLCSVMHYQNVPTVWLMLDPSLKSWDCWRMVYGMCGNSDRIKVALILNFGEEDEDSRMRWVAEPIASVIMEESCFIRCNDTVDVSGGFKQFLKQLFNYKVKIILKGMFEYHNLNPDCGILSLESNTGSVMPSTGVGNLLESAKMGIRDAIIAVKKTYASLSPPKESEIFRMDYLDVLQEPLQPLRDNLDSVTYEQFEKCSTKYALYEAAIDAWLNDFLETVSEEMSEPHKKETLTKKTHKIPVIYVLGAGRGPLVDCTLKVLNKNNIENFSVYALEKNPYTLFTLRHRTRSNGDSGWNKVKLIFDDMRHFRPPEAADLILSELLGSFGDNELSPECIDGIQRTFERNFPEKTGVTYIPMGYKSFVAPIHAPQVWTNLKSCQIEKQFHKPYTVALHSFYNIASDPMLLPCFEYNHPNEHVSLRSDEINRSFCSILRHDNEHNDRYVKLRYTGKVDGIIHGFAGYFMCTLYGSIGLSTIPGEMEELMSWFPIFFPISVPITVKKSQTITVHIWRKHDARRVWYEWAFTMPTISVIHNSNGHAYSILR